MATSFATIIASAGGYAIVTSGGSACTLVLGGECTNAGTDLTCIITKAQGLSNAFVIAKGLLSTGTSNLTIVASDIFTGSGLGNKTIAIASEATYVLTGLEGHRFLRSDHRMAFRATTGGVQVWVIEPDAF
jgi:hypothetical protein